MSDDVYKGAGWCGWVPATHIVSGSKLEKRGEQDKFPGVAVTNGAGSGTVCVRLAVENPALRTGRVTLGSLGYDSGFWLEKEQALALIGLIYEAIHRIEDNERREL